MEKRPEEKLVLLVISLPLLRLGFRHLITMDTNMRVCGEAESLAQARQKCLDLNPDLVVIDPELDAAGGFSFIQEIRVRQPAIRNMVFSGHIGRAMVEKAFKTGALAVSSYRDTMESLLKALIYSMAGKRHMTPVVAEALSWDLGGSSASGGESVEDLISPREYQVFRLVGDGYTIKEVAVRAGMSARTVESHVSHIKQKLNLGSNAELRKRAILYVGGMALQTLGGEPVVLRDS